MRHLEDTPEAVFDWAIQTAVAFVSTIAFAIIFRAPREQPRLHPGIGAFGWLIYIVYVYFTGDVVFASFLRRSASYLARVFSFARKAPLPVFLIAGIFPVVPGAGIYYTGYHIFMNNNVEAMSKGVETIKIAIAIALGIGIVVSLPRFSLHCAERKHHLKQVTIAQNDANQRVDKFLTKTYPNLPQSMLYKAIRKKDIKVNAKRCEISRDCRRRRADDVLERQFFARRRRKNTIF